MNATLLSLLSLICAFDFAGANPVRENTRSDGRAYVTSRIPHHRVDSTAIASIGYSERRHILEIEFVNGAVYRYLAITPSVFRELMIASSKARYYDANIRGKYCSVRVRPHPVAKP